MAVKSFITLAPAGWRFDTLAEWTSAKNNWQLMDSGNINFLQKRSFLPFFRHKSDVKVHLHVRQK
jgi:hypothetical protein